MHNAWPNAIIKKAPFKLIMGHIPCVHQPNQTSKSPTVENRLQQITETRCQASEAIHKAQELLMRVLSHFKPYQVRDKVWLDAWNLNTSHPSTKLAPQHYSPFSIITVMFRFILPLGLWLPRGYNILTMDCEACCLLPPHCLLSCCVL